jgi:GNAT superfamily N-acetyltransferase
MNADRAEAAFWAAFLRNRNVDAGSAGDGAVAVAGGYALCVPGTWLEFAIGAGSTRPLRPDDCEVAEAFYAVRRLPSRLELAEEVLRRDEGLLRERGYVEEDAVMAQLEAPVAAHPAAGGGIAVRTTTDRRAWSELLIRAGEAFPDQDRMRRSAPINAAAAHVLVIASLNGVDAGAAALGISGETAVLYSGGVLPAFRRHGVHGALIGARLGLAHARGASQAMLKTEPDSFAERAARRLGFERTALRRRVLRPAGAAG